MSSECDTKEGEGMCGDFGRCGLLNDGKQKNNRQLKGYAGESDSMKLFCYQLVMIPKCTTLNIETCLNMTNLRDKR